MEEAPFIIVSQETMNTFGSRVGEAELWMRFLIGQYVKAWVIDRRNPRQLPSF
jgi:hypothetical protein